MQAPARVPRGEAHVGTVHGADPDALIRREELHQMRTAEGRLSYGVAYQSVEDAIKESFSAEQADELVQIVQQSRSRAHIGVRGKLATIITDEDEKKLTENAGIFGTLQKWVGPWQK